MGHLAVGEVALGHLGPGGHVHHHVAQPLGPVDLGGGGFRRLQILLCTCSTQSN